jgi:hypothetical protein
MRVPVNRRGLSFTADKSEITRWRRRRTKKEKLRAKIRGEWDRPSSRSRSVVLKTKPVRENQNFNVAARRSAPTVSLHQPTSNVSTCSTTTSVLPMLQLVNSR